MISVPLAGLLPSTPRPVRFMNGSITSSREAVRVRRHRLRRHDAHQLPVAGRRVLALRALEQPAGDRGRAGLRRAALERLDVAEAERLERRQIEPADGPSDVAERVRADVAELVCVRKRAGTDGIENDHAGAGHTAHRTPVAILHSCRTSSA